VQGRLVVAGKRHATLLSQRCHREPLWRKFPPKIVKNL
jgi:hypothetical protein